MGEKCVDAFFSTHMGAVAFLLTDFHCVFCHLLPNGCMRSLNCLQKLGIGSDNQDHALGIQRRDWVASMPRLIHTIFGCGCYAHGNVFWSSNAIHGALICLKK
jgi:hypothetical protein